MIKPEIDQRSASRQVRDEQISAEPPLPLPELPADAIPYPVETHLARFREIKKQAEKLAQFVRSLPDFKFYDEIDGNYNHIGATVADAILQARNDYERKVKPRINRILEQYPDARTTSQVRHLLKSISATEFLNWNEKNHSERFSRAQRFCRALDLFAAEHIEAETDLRKWLLHEPNLLKLRSIKGIGQKTIDYFKILVGIPGSAMDMHLFAFLKLAGIPFRGYRDAQDIFDATADKLGVDRAHFDHSIWQFMRKRAKGKECDGPTGDPQ